MFLISACSTVKPIEINTTPLEAPELVLPPVTEVSSREITWYIVTPENQAEVFEEISRRPGQDSVLFALTADGYERLSLNSSDTITLIQELLAINAAYEGYYKSVAPSIEKHNESLREDIEEVNTGDSDSPWWRFWGSPDEPTQEQ